MASRNSARMSAAGEASGGTAAERAPRSSSRVREKIAPRMGRRRIGATADTSSQSARRNCARYGGVAPRCFSRWSPASEIACEERPISVVHGAVEKPCPPANHAGTPRLSGRPALPGGQCALRAARVSATGRGRSAQGGVRVVVGGLKVFAGALPRGARGEVRRTAEAIANADARRHGGGPT